MNDQELKCLRQGQKPSGEPALTADKQIAAMRKKMAQLHRGLNPTNLDFLWNVNRAIEPTCLLNSGLPERGV